MLELINAIELINKYNGMSLEDCVSEFETYTGQKVPVAAIEQFKFMGLNNVDMFTSDYLNNYAGLLNIFQYHHNK